MIVKAYYAFQFFFSLLLWFPIFYEYQKHFGLTDIQVYDIQSVYYIVFCLFELPTGFIADKFGYRVSLWLAGFSLVVANSLPLFWTTFPGFMTHFILIAAARSFASGAGSAYIYEYLSQQGKVHTFKQVEGNARAYGLYGKVVLWPTVGFMMAYKIELPYLATALSSLIAFLIVCFYMPSEKTFLKKEHLVKKSFLSSVAALGKALKNSPLLIMVMLQGTGIFVLARIIQVNLFQPILKEHNFSVTSFGMVLSVMTVFEALGSNKTHWLRKLGNDESLIFTLTTILALSLFLMGSFGQIGALLGFSVFSFAIGFSYPIQRQLLNDNIVDTSLRASLLSTESILDRTICAGVAPLMGIYVSSGRLNTFINLTGAVTLVVMFILYLWARALQKRGSRV